MSIQEYLPEKNFFIIIGGLVVAITIVLLVMAGIKYKNNKPQQEEAARSQNRLVTNEQALQNLQILERLDSDGDGLYDWEEALWGTNPLLADTDGDGVSDFDEVQQVKREYDLEENTTPQEELTEIDLISRDLYSTIAVLDQQGKLGETEDQIISLFQESVMGAFEVDTITIAELSLVDNAPTNKERYGQVMEGLIRDYFNLTEEDLAFISNNSTKPIKQAEALWIIDRYDTFSEEMSQVEVPVEWQGFHLDALNSLLRLYGALEAVLYADIDPLKAAGASIELEAIIEQYYADFFELS